MAKEGKGHWSGTNSAGKKTHVFDRGDGKRTFMNQRADGSWRRNDSPGNGKAKGK